MSHSWVLEFLDVMSEAMKPGWGEERGHGAAVPPSPVPPRGPRPHPGCCRAGGGRCCRSPSRGTTTARPGRRRSSQPRSPRATRLATPRRSALCLPQPRHPLNTSPLTPDPKGSQPRPRPSVINPSPSGEWQWGDAGPFISGWADLGQVPPTPRIGVFMGFWPRGLGPTPPRGFGIAVPPLAAAGKGSGPCCPHPRTPPG